MRLEDISSFYSNHLGEHWRDGPGQRPQHTVPEMTPGCLQEFPSLLRIERDGRTELEEVDRLRKQNFFVNSRCHRRRFRFAVAVAAFVDDGGLLLLPEHAG